MGINSSGSALRMMDLTEVVSAAVQKGTQEAVSPPPAPGADAVPAEQDEPVTA